MMHEITALALLLAMVFAVVFAFVALVSPLEPVCPPGSYAPAQSSRCFITAEPLGYQRMDMNPAIALVAFCLFVALCSVCYDACSRPTVVVVAGETEAKKDD